MTTANELCYCDVLLTPEEAAKEGDKRGYVIHSIIQMPRRINDGYREYVDWQIAGFWLLETQTLTRRGVTLEEMESQLAAGALLLYQPRTVRQVQLS